MPLFPDTEDVNLTPRQAEIMEVIRKTIRENGYGPTVREICNATGLKSPRSVQVHLENLQRLGCIERSKSISRSIKLPEDIGGLRLVGEITAGQLVTPFAQNDRVDLGELYDPDIHFVLRVNGDSMIDAHITSGDFVICRRADTCKDGDIIVALVDGETTLKRFRKTDRGAALEPANQSMSPIFVDDVTVQGIVVGLHRSLLANGPG